MAGLDKKFKRVCTANISHQQRGGKSEKKKAHKFF